VDVVRTYLELRTSDALRPAKPLPPDARILRHSRDQLADYRRLYREVGEQWHWRDRLDWTDDTLRAHLASPDIAVFELLVETESAGFFELRRGAIDVEIAYFGLLPKFIGRGLGGSFLTAAVDEAWRFGAKRVWLHTCTLDSPHALPNYRARGFVPFRTERYDTDGPTPPAIS
jgi:GNAT superfamily N-acetyltransferase